MIEFTRLKESDDYTRRREELRRAEVELIEQRERVAAMRRALPDGPVVDDYVFLEGPRDLDAGDGPVREVRLSELFTGPDRPLIVYHLMYGKAQTVSLPDVHAVDRRLQRDRASRRAERRLRRGRGGRPADACARTRGSRLEPTASLELRRQHVQVRPSAARTTTAPRTRRSPCSSVTPRASMRHVYTAHPWIADDIRERGIDLLCPTWHLLDLTPQGARRLVLVTQLRVAECSSYFTTIGFSGDPLAPTIGIGAATKKPSDTPSAAQSAASSSRSNSSPTSSPRSRSAATCHVRNSSPGSGRHHRAGGGVGRDHRDVVIVQPRDRARRDARLAAVDRVG